MKKIQFPALLAVCLFPLCGVASVPKTDPVLASLSMLKKIGARIEAQDASIDVGYSRLNEEQQRSLSRLMHEAGKCGGFEVLSHASLAAFNSDHASKVVKDLSALVKSDHAAAKLRGLSATSVKVEKKPLITNALEELKEENIRATVEWLSTFPSRSNRLAAPNVHVDQLEARIKEMMGAYPGMWSVNQIRHQKTKQNSLRVHIEGKTKPAEIIVLGGHLDSINQSWSGGSAAPGADDNASGSANLLETLRVLTQRGAPERSVEFFWYAGEESGLLGSAEIAAQYKAERKDVVAVLQLDMTLFPGAGEFVIGNVSDFTSSWLREYLVALNDTYLQVKLIEDECGYACSDHASWFRQGYPTLMPFESDTGRMNKKIHTDGDLIGPSSSFRHSLVFAKIALVFAMDLANSAARQP